jgi:hypothetical protein
MRIRIFVSLTLLVLFVSYGCGGSAKVEMKQAQQAMNEAKSLHAEDLAPTDFQQAQKAWDHALTAVKEGKTGTAKVLFESAKIYFGKSANIAKSKRDALSRELSSMQLMIGSNLDQVKIDLLKSTLSPNQQGQVKAIASEVDKANASIEEMAKREDFLKAVIAAKEVQTKIYHAQLILAGKRLPK